MATDSLQAQIDETKDDWLYGIWFITDRKSTDWMGTLLKRGGRWVFEYRHRYYSPESKDVWDGKDRKNWYHVKCQDGTEETRNRLLTTIYELLAMGELMMESKADFVRLECLRSDPKVTFELGSRPWAHMKIVTITQEVKP